MAEKNLEYYWSLKGFTPNPKQEKAIQHVDGPLFLTAGPGSGKTRVILWRTVNLIVFHKVDPKRIFLATFTEKAAHQLKVGLRSLLGMVTNETGQPYDVSGMAIGTVHSICQDILVDRDRNFTKEEVRSKSPVLLDSLAQYFRIYRRGYWIDLLESGGYINNHENSDPEERIAQAELNSYFIGNDASGSRHVAAINLIAMFNRFSEENLDPEKCQADDPTLKKILLMYKFYKSGLSSGKIKTVDFSLLQQQAYNKIQLYDGSSEVFDHIIIDEYQDTNTIQEKIYFALAAKNKSICVVGDDDQALYRFRGATVENLVEFGDRSQKKIGVKPTRIDLDINYRSKRGIVDFYTSFIEQTNWQKESGTGQYRIADKDIQAHDESDFPAVVTTEKRDGHEVYSEIAHFIQQLKVTGKIEDYNQVAFLFPSLGGAAVSRMREALHDLDILSFAPRAGRFLDMPEAVEIFGLLFHILDRPSHQGSAGKGLREFRDWQVNAMYVASQLMIDDRLLNDYVTHRKNEIALVRQDFHALMKVIKRNKWKLGSKLKQEMLQELVMAIGLSPKAKATLQRQAFINLVKKREQAGDPVSLKYVVNRVTSVDWSVLDLFYQLNGFKHFKRMFKLAEDGTDEGPVCNLGLITQYLSRFMEEYSPIITASFMEDKRFANTFVGSYLYAIYRLGESEYEDRDDPFPKGRVPFLTIHQAKGLEFPYIVLGGLNKIEREIDIKEVIIRDLLNKVGEPLDRINNYDIMRMFYVALSRAQQLMILPRWKRQQQSDAFKSMFAENDYPLLSEIDIDSLPEFSLQEEDLGKNYSYTADYLSYQQCPRKYMIFRKFGFIPSRSQTMFFGSLVHQTIEDLHHLLISERKKKSS